MTFEGRDTDEIIKYRLTNEEIAEKDRLLGAGFTDWSKKDLYKYIAGCEKFGNHMEKIA